MYRHLPAVALLLALAAPAPGGVISGYNPASQASHDTYDRFSSGFPTAPVANNSSAFVAAGIDLSGVGWVGSNPTFAVTLISPRHVLGAAHVGFGNGTVQFVNASGQVKTYTVTSSAVIGSSDLLLGTLSDAGSLPPSDGIRYFPVAGVTEAQAVGLPILAYGQNPNYTNPFTNNSLSPHLGTNVIDEVGNFDTPYRLAAYRWEETTPGDIYLIGGDSGGPSFVRAHGDLALIGVHYGHSGTDTPRSGIDFSADSFVPAYIDGLNAAMASSGFQVTVVPVPEPAGLLAAAGVALLAGVMRHRRRAAGLSA